MHSDTTDRQSRQNISPVAPAAGVLGGQPIKQENKNSEYCHSHNTEHFNQYSHGYTLWQTPELLRIHHHNHY